LTLIFIPLGTSVNGELLNTVAELYLGAAATTTTTTTHAKQRQGKFITPVRGTRIEAEKDRGGGGVLEPN